MKKKSDELDGDALCYHQQGTFSADAKVLQDLPTET